LLPSRLVSLTQTKVPDPLQKLADREREIRRLIGSGLTKREIGEQIFLSVKTIKHYVTNILQKLQVRSRLGAV
jgi:DNA-binding NarL/FixJ family response regulator